jgi:hypothetical protein
MTATVLKAIAGIGTSTTTTIVAGVLHQQAEGGVSSTINLWNLIQQGWAAGGLAFILFWGVILLYREDIISGKKHNTTIEEWRKRYDENDRQWRERYSNETAKSQQYLSMLFQQMSSQDRATSAFQRVANAIPTIVETHNANP